jgi:hypothetical protein
LELAPLRFDTDFAEHQRPVSHDPSRKHFFAKLLGLIAAVGLAPKLLSKPLGQSVAGPTPTAVNLRPESRAVARREESV